VNGSTLSVFIDLASSFSRFAFSLDRETKFPHVLLFIRRQDDRHRLGIGTGLELGMITTHPL
jgi:hypothetical protein